MQTPTTILYQVHPQIESFSAQLRSYFNLHIPRTLVSMCEEWSNNDERFKQVHNITNFAPFNLYLLSSNFQSTTVQ